MSGAMAMIGMVWLATMSGTMARSRIWTCTSRIARPRPSSEPSANPMAALRSVNRAAPASRSRVVAPTASRAKNSAAMSHVCGSLMSVAKGNANGGW